MIWEKLLSEERLRASQKIQTNWAFQLDFSRISFSSAFRRLQDKTQVFPLAESDYARTRLTHSIEASCVGRALGTIIGNRLIKDHDLKNIDTTVFADIVAAACLAHDIGNPPFGHSGETAFRQWFKYSEIGQNAISKISPEKRNDFLKFEGNAQGFRTLARLQYPSRPGGLQLTCATLAAFSKYPTNSNWGGEKKSYVGKSASKHGFFIDDQDLFAEVMETVGITKRDGKELWLRHPLAFLVEAADNICYHLIDFEDGFLLDKITFEEVKELLRPLAEMEETFNKKEMDSLESASVNIKDSQQQQIEYLRGKAIIILTKDIAKCFLENEKQILSGDFDEELTDNIDSKFHLNKIIEKCSSKTYKAKEVLEVEVPGFGVIRGLLEAFVSALIDIQDSSSEQYKNKKIKEYMEIVLGFRPNLNDLDDYQKLLSITDFISGMSDSYAVSIYKKITGISLPHI